MTKNNHGFTLIELIVTMAVISIVLLTGIPALTQMTTSNRLVSQINSIAGSLALARSEAIKTGSVVTLCASNDGATCNEATNWENGWIIFTDKDRDDTVDAGVDAIINIQEGLGGGSTLRLSEYDVVNIYQFLPDGSSRDRNSSGVSVGTFTLCNKEGTKSKAKALNINFIGRASRAVDNGGNGIVEDITGTTDTEDIVCP